MQGSASVLIRFSDGGGTVVAAMSGYFAHVIVEKGKVIAVNYVPSENTYRYNYYDTHRSEIEKLRGLVAASVQHGALVVSPSNASKLATRIRIEKASDPSLGLYAAYAYANAGNFDQVKDILKYMDATTSTCRCLILRCWRARSIHPIDYQAILPHVVARLVLTCGHENKNPSHCNGCRAASQAGTLDDL